MKLLPILVILLSIFTGIALLASLRGKTSIASRLSQVVPGSGLDERLLRSQPRRVRRISKGVRRQIDGELPDLIDLLCCAVLTGHSLHSGLQRVASRATGRVSSELNAFIRNVELGRTLTSELASLCERTPTAAMKEFANKVSIAIARGTPLAESLTALSSSLRTRRSNDLLSRAGANETKMLVPLVALVLPTTVIFALYPSFLALNVGFN